MNHEEKAKELFKEGYNCAQSVFCAYCEETNIDLHTALKLSSSFGGGMGRLREVCGAVTGMFMVAGVLYGYEDPTNQKLKADHYARIQKLANEFREQNNSIICRELLGSEGNDTTPIPQARTKEYYTKRPCIDLVGDAAKIIENYIKENENMRIAVTFENGQIFQHFGQTKQFKIYEVTDNNVISSQVIDAEGNGHGSLAKFLKTQNVDSIICGGIGGGAKQGLDEAEIKLYGGVSGEADLSIENLLNNTLVYDPEVECNHHDHEGHNSNHNSNNEHGSVNHGSGEHGNGKHGSGEHNCGSHS